MPGELLRRMEISSPEEKLSALKPEMDLYLIVSQYVNDISESTTKECGQSSDDVVYEQDILRDQGNIKPWLIYIDYKHQHGTLLEQAFVSCPRDFSL